jgi:dimethylamine/trimethylamine dehydrogenase
MHLLSRRFNDRHDEYGGPLVNRVRLLRELIEDTRDAVGDRCGVAVRLAVDELMGDEGVTSEGEGRDIVAMLAELPDLWDVNISGWSNDSATSRFEKEGYQERYCGFVNRSPASRWSAWDVTSPDAMVSAIRRGAGPDRGRTAVDPDPFPARSEGRHDGSASASAQHLRRWRLAASRSGVHRTRPWARWRRGWHPKSSRRAMVLCWWWERTAGLSARAPWGSAAIRWSRRGATAGGRVAREARLPGWQVAAWSTCLGGCAACRTWRHIPGAS